MGMLALLVSISAVFLFACKRKAEQPHDVVYQGEIYQVDSEKGTILHDGQTYQVQAEAQKIRILYPDGSSYWWVMTYSGSGLSGGYGGFSEDYDETKYVPGDVLLNVLEQDMPKPKQAGNPLLGFSFLILGLWNLLFPYSAWFLSRGWLYKNAEPYGFTLTFYRICGGILILLGLCEIF